MEYQGKGFVPMDDRQAVFDNMAKEFLEHIKEIGVENIAGACVMIVPFDGDIQGDNAGKICSVITGLLAMAGIFTEDELQSTRFTSIIQNLMLEINEALHAEGSPHVDEPS